MPNRFRINALANMGQYCSAVYNKYLNTYDPAERHDLIARMVTEQKLLLSKNQALPRHVTNTGIIEELTNLVFAGTDTTGNTLTYLFWELARHPEWQQRLRNEINAALDGKGEYDYNAIAELPILDAVVQETLRLRPAVPSGLQRVTPETGCVVDGTAVPSKVCLNTPFSPIVMIDGLASTIISSETNVPCRQLSRVKH